MYVANHQRSALETLPIVAALYVERGILLRALVDRNFGHLYLDRLVFELLWVGCWDQRELCEVDADGSSYACFSWYVIIIFSPFLFY